MGKIILKRTDNVHPYIPYVLTTDLNEKEFIQEELGEFYILPMFVEDGLLIGVGRQARIQIPLATAKYDNDLTQRVYDCAIKYGKRVARSLPSQPEFVDETGGPRKIEMLTLGARNLL